MLTIHGQKHGGYCDKISRRSFLSIGGLAMGGLTLPQILQAQANNGTRNHKAVIMVFLSGGAPHQDMVDLKPNAPIEYRGEFSPISTDVPGVQICELLPEMAKRMKRMSIIRSVVGSAGRHEAFQCLTGRTRGRQPAGGWPCMGSVISKIQGPVLLGTPPFVSLAPRMKGGGWADPGQPGFAGIAHAPFKPNQDGQNNLVLNGISLNKLRDRQGLRKQLDRVRHQLDAFGEMEGVDAFHEQAFGILSSSKLAEALDLEREDPRLRARYGPGSNEPAGYGDAGPINNDYFLAARRLVEAGVRVVTLAYGRWDWHGRPHGTNFENARDHFPQLDQGLTALMDDLQNRGLEKDVTVLVWGEFGRTPRINKNGGRDHWPRVSSAIFAGGGMRHGQVVGATNHLAEHAKERPVHFQEVFATLYRNLGIDVNRTTLKDFHGRPHYLVDHSRYQPISELY